MSFVANFFLWGLATLAIPVLIHLIFQKRYRRVPWAAMEFLLAAVKKTKNRLRVENLLLLLLRMLILLLLALVFARPYLTGLGLGEFLPAGANKRSVHLTIVLDRSYSMGYVDANRAIFDHARDEVRRRIDPLDPEKGDTVTLIVAGGKPAVWQGIKYSSDLEATRAALDRVELSDARDDVPALVQLLLDLGLEDGTAAGGLAAHADKRLVIVTDGQKSGWDEAGRKDSPFHEDLQRVGKDYRPIEIVVVGPPELHPPNLVVADLTTSGKVIGVGLPATFVATLKNESKAAISGIEVAFVVDGQPRYFERDLVVEAGEEKGVVFQHQFTTAGAHAAEAVASGAGVADRLATDNRRRVVFDVRDELSVLLVDGDPTAHEFDRATYFLERVLAPEGSEQPRFSIIRPKTVTGVPGDLPQLGHDVVILANVRAFDESAVGALTAYVEAGGTAILFLGDRVDPDAWNKSLHDSLDTPFLPARLGKRYFGGADLDGGTEAPPYIVPRIFEHPALRYFQGNRDLELLFNDALTREFLYLDPQPADRFDVLAAYNDGARSPAIVERAYGDGRVLLFTTSADKRWTYLPIAPLFVPLLHEFVLYGAHRDVGTKNLLVGQPYLGRYPFNTRAKAKVFPPPPVREATGEGGAPAAPEPREAIPETIGDGEGIRLFYPDTDRAGVYRIEFQDVFLRDKELDGQTDLLGINVDPDEGDLTRTSVETLRDTFPGVPFDEGDAGDEPLSRAGHELWRPLLYFALALLLVESVVAQRFGRFSK